MRCAHLQYVTESFNSSSLFHKALKEAFEAFCNKAVGGLASAELMANFCNTLLSKTVGLSVLVPSYMCLCSLCCVRPQLYITPLSAARQHALQYASVTQWQVGFDILLMKFTRVDVPERGCHVSRPVLHSHNQQHPPAI